MKITVKQKQQAIKELAQQLCNQYGTPSPSLEVVAEKLLSMKKETAYKKANEGELPFASFPVTDSTTSKKAVLVTELARYLIERQSIAESDHQALKVA